MKTIINDAIKHWSYVEPLLIKPDNDSSHEKLIHYLDDLLAIVGEKENHPLMSLINLISDHIAAYEETINHQKMGSGLDALKYLMEANDLKQSDLKEIGSQGVVSEILNGKRKLNRRQIQLLSKRFHVSPETFMEE